jgi:putative sigma-54 modulation protein
MKIAFTARRVKLHPLVRHVVERKLAKLEKVLPRDAQAHVIVEAGKKDISIEVSVAGKNRSWQATAVGPDQPAAAHAVMERIAAQAKKTKAKVKEKKKRTASAVRSPRTWAEPGGEPGPIAGPRREPVAALAMFEEDALTAFSGSTREVLVFRDLGASDAFRVLYRRRDGGFGLLIPD